MERTEPARVWTATWDRASDWAARDSTQCRMPATSPGGSMPSCGRERSTTANSLADARPRSASICARWPATSSTAPGGQRLTITATTVLRSAAAAR